jgi:LAS superfamily LD-carboxypeptidase LdcB
VASIPGSVNRNIARKIISIGKDVGANDRQILAALSAAMVESGIRNVNYGDRDSLGVFQQRPSMGWGSPEQVRDVDYATKKFYKELLKLNWHGSIGHMAQQVQRSAFPDRYDQRGLPVAQALFKIYGGEAGFEQKIGPDKDSKGGGGDDNDRDFDDLDDDGIEGLWHNIISSMSDRVMASAEQMPGEDADEFSLAGDYFDELAEAQDEPEQDPVVSTLGQLNRQYNQQVKQEQRKQVGRAKREARTALSKLARERSPGVSKNAPKGFGGFSNGRIPGSALYKLKTQRGHMLRKDAGQAWDLMYRAARKDGVNLRLTDSYRSYSQQVDLKRRKPSLAATPGKSNHGWGVAVDISVGGFTTATYRWLQRNAYRFGYTHPTWAREQGSKPEPWHWEFVGTRQAQPVGRSPRGTGGKF